MTLRPFKPGEIVLSATITKRHGKHAARALVASEHLSERTTTKKQPLRHHKVLQAFPEDVAAHVRNHFLQPVEDALDYVYNETEGLRGELEEWYGNLPDSFQNGDKGEQLQDAISELEDLGDFRGNMDEKELDRIFMDLPKVPVWPSGSSRSDRAQAASDVLEAVQTLLQEAHDAKKGLPAESILSTYKEAIEYVEDHCDRLRSISFPGMY